MVNALLLNFHGLSDIHYQKKCFAPIFVESNYKYYPIIKRAAHLQGQN